MLAIPRAVAISPHLDDAVFSCGGTLALLVQAGWDVTVCSLFTRSVVNPGPFALSCQLDKGLAPEADYMAIRRAEDARACGQLGAVPIWLNFSEAPHRGYDQPAALFDAVRADDEVHLDLAAALAHVLLPLPDLVLAPQAVGGHVDHVQTVRALRLTLPPEVPLLWWTDFPYAMRPNNLSARPYEQQMADLPSWYIKGDAASRQSACAAYATQLGFQFGGHSGLVDILAAAGAMEHFRVAGGLTSSIFCLLRTVLFELPRSR